ncbi:MAG TPA: hypothetical protein VKB69_01590 [Micromonosporaceae bacterium]|nr:hypothetical protein [Micromonosporaceae bacterium]
MRDHSATLADVDAQPPESAPVRVAADVLPEPAARPLAPVIPTGVAFAGPRRVGWRLVLAVVLAVLPLLGIAGLAIAYHLYDRATRPDRSTPAVATYNYLQAFLNDGSQVEAAQFRCADASGLAGFESFWNSQKDFAASKDDTVTFSWLISDTPTTGDAATVSVVITQQTMSKGQEIGESKHAWSLVARKGSEWRICSATPAG